MIEPGAPPAGVPLTLRHPEPPIVMRRVFAPPLASAWMRVDLAYPPDGMVDARLLFVFADGARLPQRLAKVSRNRFRGLFRPASPLEGIEIHLSGSAPLDAPLVCSVRPVSTWERRLALARRSLDVLRGDPRSFLWRAARFAVQVRRQGRTTIPIAAAALPPREAYALWRERFDERNEDVEPHRARPDRLEAGPRFTVIADPDADATQRDGLRTSLEAQLYAGWDLVVPEAGSRAGSLAAALARSTGPFILLPCPGTVFRPHALAVFAAAIARHPAAELVYADDDDLLGDGRGNPRFKPAWSPVRALAFDYVGDPCCVSAARLVAAGGLGEGDRYDLLRRVTADIDSAAVVHIAQVLSHRRPAPAHVADRRPPHRRTIPAIPAPAPLVSLIIPTRDRADLLRMAIGSIRARTAYAPYEIIVVDNGSREAETLRLFESWAGDPVIRVLPDPNPFNYAALNNRAVATARGTLVGLVNNDIEVLDDGWLGEMVGWALRPGIGCVGAKLYYPDGRLQHGGVVTGIAGAAGHRRKRATRDDPGMLDELVTVNEVSAVTAACLVVRKSIYEEVGGLDAEGFAVAYNDVDFCLKVRARGYRNLWTPFAELNHHESVSRGRDLSPRTAERFDRENLNLRLRWGEALLDDPYYSPNLTVDAENGAIRTQ
ncbi:MAG TPA: glycosyltransferase family 2 protein [Lichenihabitans sp.]|nr:glycosyltransferase family 2 protein [Lichenihabitans sp.]